MTNGLLSFVIINLSTRIPVVKLKVIVSKCGLIDNGSGKGCGQGDGFGPEKENPAMGNFRLLEKIFGTIRFSHRNDRYNFLQPELLTFGFLL